MYTDPWVQSSLKIPDSACYTNSQCCLSPSVSHQPNKLNTLSCTLFTVSENCLQSTTWKSGYLGVLSTQSRSCLYYWSNKMLILAESTQRDFFVFFLLFFPFNIFLTLGAICKKPPTTHLTSGIQNIFKVTECLY